MKLSTRIIIALLPIAVAIGLGNSASAATDSMNNRDDEITRRIGADSVMSFTYRVEAGEFTWFEMEGFGSTDLDLHVYDQYGDLLAADEDLDDDGLIYVRLPRAQTLTIEVSNLGRVSSTFSLSASTSQGFMDIDSVDAYSTYRRSFYVPAGVITWFEIRGDGDTDLDFVILDEYGRELASDFDYTDETLLVIELDRPQYVTIEIENLGSVYNMYELFIH